MEKYIGCSGYYYNHWINRFYPEDLPKKKWLPFYAEHFNTVEINNTFYRMPEEKPVKNWYSITPGTFVFSVKGYRFLTHLKKLIIDETSLDYLSKFQHTVSFFKDKLGPLLWQLPGSFTLNLPRLEKFCSVLSSDFQHIFEFRHESWFTQNVYDILEKYNHGLCIVSSPRNVPEIVKITSDIAYIRFHGKGAWYNDDYGDEDLQLWKNKLENKSAKKLYAYFNNDANAYAVKNGEYFASLFKESASKAHPHLINA